MNERDLIATQTIKQVSEGGDKVRADLKATASAQDQLAASSTNLATVTETSARRQTSAAAAFNAMARSMDPASRAFETLEKNQATFGRTLAQNSSTLDKAGQDLSYYRDKLNAAAVAAENLRRQQGNASVNQGAGFSPGVVNKNTYAAEFASLMDIADQKAMQIGKQFGEALDASLIAGTAKAARDSASVFEKELDRLDEIAHLKALQAGKNFQDSLNQSMGIGVAPKSASASMTVFEDAAKAQDAMAASATKLRSAINPLEAEQGKLGVETAHYRDLLKQNIITQDEFNAHQVITSKRLGDFAQNLKVAGTAGRVMSGEMTNLGFQLNDVVTGLALGQSPFMILGQQGGQIVQIFANSKASIADFARSSMGWFTGLFTVARVAFGGIAAAVGTALYANQSYISSQREVTQALIGVGAKTQTTAAQINDFAKQNASATGLSVDQARNVAVEFTKTGNISVAGIKGVGEAIHGFSILTGQSVEDASKTFAKAFSGDVVSGAEELNKTYGFLNATTRDYIRTLELQGNRSAAIQVIIDAIAKDSLRAAESTSLWAKAYDYLANAASKAKNAIGAGTTPQSNEDQLAALEKQKAALEVGSQKSSLAQVHDFISPEKLLGGLFSGSVVVPGLDAINKSIDDLKEKIAGVKADNVVKQLDAMSLAGDNAVRSIIPQIAQLEKLKAEEEALRAAQNTPGVKINTEQSDAAILANKNLQAATRESEAEAARYNQQVAKIAQSWGNVGQSVALQLQTMQNSLPVAQAWTEAGRMKAQYEATYLDLINKGKTVEEASALAAKQYELSKAAAVASGNKAVQASQDNLDAIKAQGTEMEGVVASTIAFRDAMNAGYTATQAAAISANVLEANLLQAAAAADRVAQSAQDAQNALITKLGGGDAAAFGSNGDNTAFGGPNQGAQFTSTSNLGNQILRAYNFTSTVGEIVTQALTGGVDAAIQTLKTTRVDTGTDYAPGGFSAFGITPKATQDDVVGALTSLYDIKANQAGSAAEKTAIQKDELAALFAQPQSAATLSAIQSLTASMTSLTSSTNSLNATNTELLSPYYTQDPRTSHIGFRSQGMATTGYVDIPGTPSANDNMTLTLPVASGERVFVGNGPNRGNGGSPINVVNHINVSGNVDKQTVNAIGRTVFQSTQSAAKNLAAAR